MASPPSPPDRYLGADYNCCGGRIKYNDDDVQRREKTASDEMYEETRTLLSCSSDQLALHPFVDIVHKLGRVQDIFRCYIYKIECSPDICQQFEQFDQSTLPDNDDFYEVKNLALFPIEQFRTKKSWSKINENSIAKNSKGKEKPLNRRVISVIEAALEQNLL